MLYFEQIYKHIHTKMKQVCGKNNFTLEERKL